MRKLTNEIKYFLNNRLYIFSVLITVLITYGFCTTHTTLSIDSLTSERYISGGELIAQGRFTLTWIVKLFKSFLKPLPFAQEIISLLFFVLGIIIFCVIFRRASNDRLKTASYIFFSVISLSYPLICEMWICSFNGLMISINYFFVACALYLAMRSFEYENKLKKAVCLILSTLLVFLFVSTYESGVSVFVFGVFALLLLNFYYTDSKIKLKKTIFNGLIYAIPLCAGVLFEAIFQTAYWYIFNIEKSVAAENIGLIFSRGLKNMIWTLRFGLPTYIADNFFLKGLFYLPIGIFAVIFIAAVVFAIISCIKRKKASLVLLYIGLLASPFLLSLVAGACSPYRTLQVFAVFIAFVIMLFLQKILDLKNKKPLKTVSIILLSVFAVQQMTYTSSIFEINNRRYEQEKQIIHNIGYKLQSEFDLTKPVIFIHNQKIYISAVDDVTVRKNDSLKWKLYSNFFSIIYNKKFFPDKVLPESIRYTETAVSNFLIWSCRAFNEPNTEILAYFKYEGYNLKQGTDEMYTQAFEKAKSMTAYPSNGYIVDNGDFIIVKLT